MKKEQKLTARDYRRMWGEDGPYSQVRLCEETRILDDCISRIFLVVEAEINPFTFECVQKYRQSFAYDEPVLQLLEHAEYRGKFGYVVSAGEVKLEDEGSQHFARKQADMAIQALIRMHEFVMEKYGLTGNIGFDIAKDKADDSNHLLWDTKTGRVEPAADDGMWDDETFIGGPAGVRNNKMRFFIILAVGRGFDFREKSTSAFANALKKVSANSPVEIEDVESFQEYICITALLPFDVVPANFIETVLDRCNRSSKKPLFKKDYLVTNVKKPTPAQIMSFLEQAK